MSAQHKSNRDPSPSSNAPWLEIAASLIGAVLVIAVVVTLLAEGARRSDAAPQLRVVAGEVRESASGYVLDVMTVNDGDRTAANVSLRGQLLRDGEVIERSELVVEDIPQHSSVRAYLVFANDPATMDVDVRVQGFTDP